MIRALSLFLLLAATPLESAKEHLAAGKLDDVLFDLDGKKLGDDEKPQAAALLGDAAAAAVAKKDELLALQFAQMALKLDPNQAKALEAAARTSFKQQQFEAAEKYADRWIVVDPKSGPPRILRAELAAEAGEWQVVIDQLDQVKLKGAEAETAKALRARATKEVKDKQNALSTIATLERQMAEAAVKARASGGGSKSWGGGTSDVVVYSTAWCPYCKKAKDYLKKKGVAFTEKDVEKQPEAAKELAEKAVAAGVRPGGVPVIDVRGKLILGFDKEALDAAL